MVDGNIQPVNQDATQNQQSAQPQIQIPQDIRGFLEDILLTSDMVPENDIMHEIMLQQIFDRLDKFVAIRLVELLSDEDAEAFIKLNEAKASKEEIDKFIEEHIPNAKEAFVKILLDFKDAYTSELAPQAETKNETA
jgi:hypothetical protein